MDRLKSRATELEIRINAELFGEARVVASTLVGANSMMNVRNRDENAFRIMVG